ncbi:MAG: hypothetical protein ACYC27_16635 [Armatimonadota bacterium]
MNMSRKHVYLALILSVVTILSVALAGWKVRQSFERFAHRYEPASLPALSKLVKIDFPENARLFNYRIFSPFMAFSKTVFSA